MMFSDSITGGKGKVSEDLTEVCKDVLMPPEVRVIGTLRSVLQFILIDENSVIDPECREIIESVLKKSEFIV